VGELLGAEEGENGMNLKTFGLCGMVLALLGASAVHAQSSKPSTRDSGTTLVDQPATFPSGPPDSTMVSTAGLSNWITGNQQECMGPMGGNGPIRSELYLRAGPSVPIGGGFFNDTLKTGWEIQGGGRTLFFNTQGDAAWTVDLSLSNINNTGRNPNDSVTLHNVIVAGPPSVFGGSTSISVPSLNVTTRSLNRTFVNLGFGREMYLYGAPDAEGLTWRVGIDGGGRYGSAKLETHEIVHRTDTIAGMFVSLHSDVEIPYGCITLLAGFRIEWDYTWMDILQSQNNSDLQDLNLLFTAGIRF
jgi:hypothetical protein